MATRVLFFICALMIGSSSAFAQICVELDSTRDGLSEQDQKSVVLLLTETFAGEGEETTDAPCDDVYKVYHLKFGNAVTVVVSGAKGTRKLRANSLEEVPSAYAQIVRALIAGTEITAEDTRTRKNVIDDQAAPDRVKADNLIYFSLGGGMTFGGPESTMMDRAVTYGLRHELDNFALDISVRYQWADKGRQRLQKGLSNPDYEDVDEITHANINIRGLHFAKPRSSTTLYFGGGIGAGGSSFYRHDREWQGEGIVATAVVGYEMMRTSTIRFFVESSVLLPFYTANDELGNSRWVPAMIVTVGGAWTKLPGSDCCH